MTKLNTLLGIIVSTLLLANVASAQTIEIVKAEPIDPTELHAAVKLQLQDTMVFSTTEITATDLPINTLLAKNSLQDGDKTLNIAKIDYNAD